MHFLSLTGGFGGCSASPRAGPAFPAWVLEFLGVCWVRDP